ncbi:MAG: hypothetical protein CMK44_05940 [Porticoccus sp.]|nr:hypothetical protein [Porticoccus sp.]
MLNNKLAQIMSTDEKKFIDLSRENSFTNEVIIVDGQARSGKNMVAILLTTMARVEKMRLNSQMDNIPRFFGLGKMTEDAAIIALKTELDENIYYNSISRDVNFRLSDYTGVLKQGKRWLYIKRLFQGADDDAIKRIKKENPIFQEMTHDGIQYINLYFKVLGDRLKFIHVLRHPVNNIFEQNNRDFGTRIGKDPRELQLTFKWKKDVIPLMAVGYEELWIKGSPLEKLVVIVDAMFRKNIASIQSLSELQKKQILLLSFDHFVKNPKQDLLRLEEFIGQTFGSQCSRILRRENCPREVPADQIKERYEVIHSCIKGSYKELFEKMIEDYDQTITELVL